MVLIYPTDRVLYSLICLIASIHRQKHIYQALKANPFISFFQGENIILLKLVMSSIIVLKDLNL